MTTRSRPSSVRPMKADRPPYAGIGLRPASSYASSTSDLNDSYLTAATFKDDNQESSILGTADEGGSAAVRGDWPAAPILVCFLDFRSERLLSDRRDVQR